MVQPPGDTHTALSILYRLKAFREIAFRLKIDFYFFFTRYSLGIGVIVCCTMTAGPSE